MGKKSTGQRKDKSHVLTDHRKIGSRFVPPFLQTGTFEFVPWVEQILPEILWIGLLQSRLGTKAGVETSLQLAQAASEIGDPRHLYALASSYSKLTTEQQTQLIARIRASGLLTELADGLWPLLRFYPDSPFRFLGVEAARLIHDPVALLEEFKAFLYSLFSRTGVPATFMQTTAIYLGFGTGKLHVMEGLSLGNLAPVEQYPDTEESRKVAAGVRAATTMFCASPMADPAWSRYFWNRGLELESCDCRLLWGE